MSDPIRDAVAWTVASVADAAEAEQDTGAFQKKLVEELTILFDAMIDVAVDRAVARAREDHYRW